MADDTQQVAQEQQKPYDSSYLLQGRQEAILEAAPDLHSGLSMLQDSYTGSTWSDPQKAADSTAYYAQQLRYRFFDKSTYEGTDADLKAPISLAEIPLTLPSEDKVSTINADGSIKSNSELANNIVYKDFVSDKTAKAATLNPKADQSTADYINLKQIDDWEQANITKINSSHDPDILLEKQKLLDSVQSRASELRQNVKGKDAGFFSDAFYRTLQGASGGIAKLTGTEDFLKRNISEYINPEDKPGLVSQAEGTLGFIGGATGSFLVGGPYATLMYLGLTGGEQVASTYKEALKNTGDLSKARSAAELEYAGQLAQLGGIELVGGKLFGALVSSAEEALPSVSQTLKTIGVRTAQTSAAFTAGGAFSTAAKQEAEGQKPTIGSSLEGAGDNFLLSLIFGPTAGGVEAGARAIAGIPGGAADYTEPSGFESANEPHPLVQKVNIGAPVNPAKGVTNPNVSDFKDSSGRSYKTNSDGATETTEPDGTVRHPMDRTYFVTPEIAQNLKILEDAAKFRGMRFVITTDGDNLLVKKSEERQVQPDEVGAALINLSNASKLRSTSSFVNDIQTEANKEAVLQSGSSSGGDNLDIAKQQLSSLPLDPKAQAIVIAQRAQNLRDLNNSGFVKVPINENESLGSVPVQVSSPRTSNGVDVVHNWHIGDPITEINPENVSIPESKLPGESTIGAAAAPKLEEGFGYSKIAARIRTSSTTNPILRLVAGTEEEPNPAMKYVKVSDLDAKSESSRFISERGGIQNATNEALSWNSHALNKSQITVLGDLYTQWNDAFNRALAAGDNKSAEIIQKYHGAISEKLAEAGTSKAQGLQAYNNIARLINPEGEVFSTKTKLEDHAAEETALANGVTKEEVKQASDKAQVAQEELDQINKKIKPIKEGEAPKPLSTKDSTRKTELEKTVADNEKVAKDFEAKKAEKLGGFDEKARQIKQLLNFAKESSGKPQADAFQKAFEIQSEAEKDLPTQPAKPEGLLKRYWTTQILTNPLGFPVKKTIGESFQAIKTNAILGLRDLFTGRGVGNVAEGAKAALKTMYNSFGPIAREEVLHGRATYLGDTGSEDILNSDKAGLNKKTKFLVGRQTVLDKPFETPEFIKNLVDPKEIVKARKDLNATNKELSDLNSKNRDLTTEEISRKQELQKNLPTLRKNLEELVANKEPSALSQNAESALKSIGGVSPEAEAALRFIGRRIDPRNTPQIFRLASAPFKVFMRSGREFYASYLANRAAQDAGLSGQAQKEYVSQRLYNSSTDAEVALNQANKEAETLKGLGIDYSKDQIALRAMDIIDEKRDSSLRESSRVLAGKLSFTKPPEGLAGQFISSLGRALAGVEAKGAEGLTSKPLQWFSIFYNTLGNIVDNGMEFVPGGSLANYIYTEVGKPTISNLKENFLPEKGNLSAENVDKEMKLTKMVAGMGATAALVALKSYGQIDIHGSGPSDYQKRAQLLQQGWKPWSIQIGNTYIGMGEANPLSMIVGALGEYSDREKYDSSFHPGFANNFLSTYVAGALSSNMSVGFLDSISNLLGALKDKNLSNEQVVSKVESLLIQPISGFVPFSGLLKQISKDFDNPIETYNSIWAKMIQGMPGVQHLVGQPRLNIFGEPAGASWTDKLGSGIGGVFSFKSSDPNFRWLGDNNYTIPDVYGLTIKLDKRKKPNETMLENRTAAFGAAYANVMTPEERTDYELKLGPEIKSIVERYRDTYTTSGRQQYIQDSLDKEIKAASKALIKENALKSLQ